MTPILLEIYRGTESSLMLMIKKVDLVKRFLIVYSNLKKNGETVSEIPTRYWIRTMRMVRMFTDKVIVNETKALTSIFNIGEMVMTIIVHGMTKWEAIMKNNLGQWQWMGHLCGRD